MKFDRKSSLYVVIVRIEVNEMDASEVDEYRSGEDVSCLQPMCTNCIREFLNVESPWN
jgi:hypothetical protein